MTDVWTLADTYAEENKRDILLCSGPMGSNLDTIIHEIIPERQHPNILLIPTTGGGDPHVAYRVARLLQQTYKHIQVFVPGWCKSAGTLLAICGHELIMGDRGELGPLDIQLGRPDELWERRSGLTEKVALDALASITWEMFRDIVIGTKAISEGQITFKTAADSAVPLVSGILSPILAQIDPSKIGENARALSIASVYADRLNECSENLKERSRERLVTEYPDHRFVIDRKEAETLFVRVEKPNDELVALCIALGEVALYPQDQCSIITYINGQKDNLDHREFLHVIQQSSSSEDRNTGTKERGAKEISSEPDGSLPLNPEEGREQKAPARSGKVVRPE